MSLQQPPPSCAAAVAARRATQDPAKVHPMPEKRAMGAAAAGGGSVAGRGRGALSGAWHGRAGGPVAAPCSRHA
jgi:hypothetical protein